MNSKCGAIQRKVTRQIMVGPVPVGGAASVTVQSMTNTPTQDVAATMAQVRRLEEAGCEIVRLAVPDAEAVAALVSIKKQAKIPVIADIHFDHQLAIGSIRSGVDGLRINPGNIGGKRKIREVFQCI